MHMPPLESQRNKASSTFRSDCIASGNLIAIYECMCAFVLLYAANTEENLSEADDLQLELMPTSPPDIDTHNNIATPTIRFREAK